MTTSTRDEYPGQPPTEVSKPVGDAIPAAVEPGLNRPLPSKEGDEDRPGHPEPALGTAPPDDSEFT